VDRLHFVIQSVASWSPISVTAKQQLTSSNRGTKYFNILLWMVIIKPQVQIFFLEISYRYQLNQSSDVCKVTNVVPPHSLGSKVVHLSGSAATSMPYKISKPSSLQSTGSCSMCLFNCQPWGCGCNCICLFHWMSNLHLVLECYPRKVRFMIMGLQGK
jgi:hypothetical protein